MEKSKYYISAVDEVDEKYHRSPIIIHTPDFHYIAEFKTFEQLDFYARLMGFTYELREEREAASGKGMYREYNISHEFAEPLGYGGFWSLSEIPAEAKPFKGHSNGNIVTCYFWNDGKTINIYRPNGNAKEVYNPLDIDAHIAHTRIYGGF